MRAHWKYLILLLIFLSHPISGNELIRDELAQLSGSATVRTDLEGLLISRVALTVGPARFLMLREGTLLLRDVTLAPQGYERIRVRVGASGETGWLALGFAAGPLIIGPMREEGVFQRFRDPTAGGVRWTALEERDRFTLDTRLQRPLRQGAVVSSGPVSRLAGAPVATAWLTSDAEERDVVGFHVGHSFYFPHGHVHAALLSAYSRVVPRDDQFIRDPWVFPAPPMRGDQLYHYGLILSVHRVFSHLTVEGWRQHTPYQPPRYAGTVAVRLGEPSLEIASRVSAAQIGFRTVTHRPPAHSFFAGTRISHRRRSETMEYDAILDISQYSRWHAGLPAPGAWHGVAQVGTVVRHSLRPGSTIRVDWRQHQNVRTEARFFIGTGAPLRIAGRATVHDTGVSHVAGTVNMNVPMSLGTIRTELSGTSYLEDRRLWVVSSTVTIPFTQSGSVSIVAKYDPRETNRWEGTITGTIILPGNAYQSPR